MRLRMHPNTYVQALPHTLQGESGGVKHAKRTCPVQRRLATPVDFVDVGIGVNEHLGGIGLAAVARPAHVHAHMSRWTHA